MAALPAMELTSGIQRDKKISHPQNGHKEEQAERRHSGTGKQKTGFPAAGYPSKADSQNPPMIIPPNQVRTWSNGMIP